MDLQTAKESGYFAKMLGEARTARKWTNSLRIRGLGGEGMSEQDAIPTTRGPAPKRPCKQRAGTVAKRLSTHVKRQPTSRNRRRDPNHIEGPLYEPDTIGGESDVEDKIPSDGE